MQGFGMREWLASHPKLIAVLFTLTVLLSQAGMVLAGGGTTGAGYAGP